MTVSGSRKVPIRLYTVGFACQEDRAEAEHVLRAADAVRRHVFLFDMEWDMERTYEPVEFGDIVDWEYNPGDDPEFTWQFNRHRFLLCMGQAYRMTGGEGYVACMLDLMQQFIVSQADVASRRPTTWRILEIGIRAANWIKALYMIRDSHLLTDELLSLFKESLKEHASIIMNEHYMVFFARLGGHTFPDSLHESIRRMAMAGFALRKPDGQQLSMGDSDDMNTRSIYALAAYVYEDPVFPLLTSRNMRRNWRKD